MQLTVCAKQAGRKYPLLANKTIEIDEIGPRPTLRALILAVVKQQVAEYNSQSSAEKNLLPFLSKVETEGKISFGGVYNENKADLTKAQDTAILAYTDGLFAVFAGETEISSLGMELDATAVITFIRLTFLAGSYW